MKLHSAWLRFACLLFLAGSAVHSTGGVLTGATSTPDTPPQFSAAPAASRPLDSIRGWLGGSPSQPTF